jgi:phage terminase large subunit-like protein
VRQADEANVFAQARAEAQQGGWDGRWIRTNADARATLNGCWFDLSAAEHARDFIQGFLRIDKGPKAGEPFTLLPWQWERVITPLFGWKRADGTRRFRRALIFIAKKNGKSSLAAAIALYLLVADGEQSAEVYCCALDRWQASVVHDVCAAMVDSSPHLARQLEVIASRKVIAFPKTRSKLEALSADVGQKEGISASGIVFDELHTQKTRGLFSTLAYSGAARRQPLLVMLTTAGVVEPDALWLEQYEYAKGVEAGTIEDDAFLPVIFEAPADADWTDSSAWRLANPSLGTTVTQSELAEACKVAQASPAQQSDFRRYRLNQPQQQTTRFVDMAQWAANDAHGIDPQEWKGRRVYGGLDLSSTSDMNALVWITDCPHEAGAIDVACQVWLPEGALRKSRHAQLYSQWAKAGSLALMPGAVSDYGFIRAAVLKDAQRMVVDSIGADALFQGLELATALSDEGLRLFPVRQGYTSLSPLLKEFERLLLAGRIHHGNHPVLAWCVNNMEVRTDAAGNRKPTRENQAAKIDLAVALLMAIDRYARKITEPQSFRSRYEEEDLFTI